MKLFNYVYLKNDQSHLKKEISIAFSLKSFTNESLNDFLKLSGNVIVLKLLQVLNESNDNVSPPLS